MSPLAWHGSWISKACSLWGLWSRRLFHSLETIDSICKWGQDHFSVSFWHFRLQLLKWTMCYFSESQTMAPGRNSPEKVIHLHNVTEGLCSCINWQRWVMTGCNDDRALKIEIACSLQMTSAFNYWKVEDAQTKETGKGGKELLRRREGEEQCVITSGRREANAINYVKLW